MSLYNVYTLERRNNKNKVKKQTHLSKFIRSMLASGYSNLGKNFSHYPGRSFNK